KGGNFAVGDIVEREIVERNGGEIRLLPQDEELDTESLIRRVVKNHGG
ncbi:D-glycero-beta-D-manno-heptose 1-phosphate adenylyltransferase, partial [Candidatus Woesearchaeota archaeon CG11_big_fil_rev_8_21_14_0_20_57_5]